MLHRLVVALSVTIVTTASDKQATMIPGKHLQLATRQSKQNREFHVHVYLCMICMYTYL